ncbi:hypothetical protein [Stenotrophomonas maltophilia]|uniref:hypothetical protein n=1 Tax=Stenotrophomonas maltophilia TaxID=40324 RepID=UPI001FA7E81A|nr:hypothetical protein [Stenotrophomonas maltophilia]
MRPLAELLQALLQLCQRPVRLRVQVQASRQGRAQQCASGAHDRLQQHAVLALIEIIAARQLQLWIIPQRALPGEHAAPGRIDQRGKHIIHDRCLAQCRGRSTCRPAAFHSG